MAQMQRRHRLEHMRILRWHLDAGHTSAETATFLGVSRRLVTQWARGYNFAFRLPYRCKVSDEKFIACFKTGMNSRAMSKELGIARSSVCSRARSLNLKLPGSTGNLRSKIKALEGFLSTQQKADFKVMRRHYTIIEALEYIKRSDLIPQAPV